MVKRIFILFLTIYSIAYSQMNHEYNFQFSPRNYTNSVTSDALNSLDNTLKLIKSPLHFDNSDLTLAGVVIAMTGAALSLDNNIRHDIAKTKSENLDNITFYGEKFGRPVYPTILSGILYASGLFTGDNRLKETGQILAEAMICTGIFTQLLKVTLGRARPYTGDSNTDIDFLEFEFSSNENSLPSGHTSIAFTVATVLSERIDNIFASTALYSLATLTAFQRIYSDVHWFSDTLLGAALGTFIGLKLVKLHEQNESETENFNFNIFPQINPTSYGVGFSLQF